jgi:glycosyltransferase involved in cell wall biosynthesis
MTDFSIIVPVYRNEENIPSLLDRLNSVCRTINATTEVVFVVDGSPDSSEQRLLQTLPVQSFPAQLVTLSRNFGSFNAIRAGLECARGRAYGVIAADLQEPPELLLDFAAELLAESCDVCVGKRVGRHDAAGSRLLSNLFWSVYRQLVQPQMPPGGLDVFGCNRKVRDVLVSLHEANSSLVGQLIWLGFRRKDIPYQRAERQIGKSGWTFSRKWKYMADSIYSFTDLPIRLLTSIGVLGAGLIAIVSLIVVAFWLGGAIQVPGYTALMLAVLFVGFTNILGLGVVGNYVWRCFENSKQRPLHIVMSQKTFSGTDANQ